MVELLSQLLSWQATSHATREKMNRRARRLATDMPTGSNSFHILFSRGFQPRGLLRIFMSVHTNSSRTSKPVFFHPIITIRSLDTHRLVKIQLTLGTRKQVKKQTSSQTLPPKTITIKLKCPQELNLQGSEKSTVVSVWLTSLFRQDESRH